MIKAISYKALQNLSAIHTSKQLSGTTNGINGTNGVNGASGVNGFKSTHVEDNVGAVILHSSGTTGLPKPILLTNRYLLGYATCHRLQPEESEGRLNVSTMPLYHVSIFFKSLKPTLPSPGFRVASSLPESLDRQDLLLPFG